MASRIRQTFARCRKEGRPAMLSFITAGYPSPEETVPIMQALQAGGTDIIELGMPFTDPLADGPAIQKANTMALEQKVYLDKCLDLIRQARKAGVHVPVLLMGYYNPVMQYGEEKLIENVAAAGGNGFLMVDLPPHESSAFRNKCTEFGLSSVPLVTPVTDNERLRALVSIADSFIYVVSRMGPTGSTGSLDPNVDALLKRVREHSGDTPLAVGFGISTREHVQQLESVADGVVIGSYLIKLILDTKTEDRPEVVRKYINEVVGGRHVPDTVEEVEDNYKPKMSLLTEQDDKEVREFAKKFGEFGGQYVPEVLFSCLNELEKGFQEAAHDATFWEEYRSYYPYMGRPSSLHLADQLSKQVGGAQIWLKREDLNHTGSHKINNALGQCLLAKRLGKTKVIAETGAGQHGVATATIAAKFGLKCTVYMGSEDARRQALNVFRMKLLGAEVIKVENGTKTLRDACSEALRGWVTQLSTTHYVLGSATGPHPFPSMVRTFQSIIGKETKAEFARLNDGKLPDAVVACVGGGSNCAGMFSPFAVEKLMAPFTKEQCDAVKLLGVEAGGDGVDSDKHCATLNKGNSGVLHGAKTLILQDKEGQVQDTHSISAGLDYPGVGPELSSWKANGRATFIAADDLQAMKGFKLLSQTEGIIPAMESAHAVYGAVELAKTMTPDQHIVICLSGRGDKDVQNVADLMPEFGPKMGWDLRFEQA